MRRTSHPLWRFSLRVYRREGVEQACLGLQSACGADVNLLLLCCWMGIRRKTLGEPFLRRVMAAVSRWQSEVVQPLRRARRALKQAGIGAPRAWRVHLREPVSRLELEAEYVEQRVLARLAALAPPRPRSATAEQAVSANLENYLGLLGTPIGVAAKRRLQTLRSACLQRRG